MTVTTLSDLSRRDIIRLTVSGAVAGLLPFAPEALAVPEAATGPGIVETQRDTLAAFADTLVPGAADAKVVDFVSAMVASPDPMLCYKYMSFPLPPAEFYHKGLTALDDLSQKKLGKRFAAATPDERSGLIPLLRGAPPEGWDGPPPGLFLFIVRNDAQDMVYGGEDAYEKLGIPYMPHIMPPSKW